MTLTEFLLARLDEDEAVAEKAVEGYYEPSAGWYGDGDAEVADAEKWLAVHLDPYGQWLAVTLDPYGLYDEDPHMIATARQIIRHSPARVLAEVEVKRRIVRTYAAHSESIPGMDEGFHNCGDRCTYAAMDWTLAVLALPYADHPDYDEGWRP